MYYSKCDRIETRSFVSWIRQYVWKKLKQFYPLHLITFLIACIVGRVWLKPLYETVIGALLNLLLINPFFPKYAMVFNGLSWYLAITIFLYFIGYFLLVCSKKIKRIRLCILILLMIIAVVNVISRFVSELYLYSNPVYRLLDFWLGIMIAKLFIEEKKNGLQFARPNMIEFGIVGAFLIQYVLSLVIKPGPGYYSVLFSVSLFVFSMGQGIVSVILSSKFFEIVARYSFEFYMIHELSLRVFRKVFADVALPYPVLLIVIAVPSLAVSVVFAFLFKHIRFGDKRIST